MEQLNIILKEFECPVCTKYMVEKISICVKGHSLCKNCKDNLSNCPICKYEFAADRNFCFENVAEKLTYKCRNEKCNKVFDSKNINEHENNCKFGVHSCVFVECCWIGKLSEYREHVKCQHKEYIDDFKMAGSSNIWICIVFYMEETFVIFSKIEEKFKMYSTMYMGTKKNAKDFLFNIKFVDQTKKGYRLNAASPCIGPCATQEVFGDDKLSFSVDDNSLLEKCFKVDFTYKITITIEENI